MRLQFEDHSGFQRAAFAAVAAGAALAAVGWVLDLSGRGQAVGVMGAVALVLAIAVGRAEVSRRRRLVAAVAALGAGWLAHRSGAAFVEAWFYGPVGLVDAGAGAVVGLVATLGMVPLHLVIERDEVARALAAASAELRGPGRELCERAAAAERQIGTALTADRLPEAQALLGLSRALAVNAVTLARKIRQLDDTMSAADGAQIEVRLAALAGQRATAADEGTAREYDRALGALRDQHEHLATIAGAADRLRAHLHGQVTVLEATALALAARRGALAADEAASLGPLVERLRDVSAHAQAEAVALAAT